MPISALMSLLKACCRIKSAKVGRTMLDLEFIIVAPKVPRMPENISYLSCLDDLLCHLLEIELADILSVERLID